MTMIPVLSPVLPDNPDTWRTLDERELRIATETDENGLLTRRAMAMRQRMLDDRWYLVRNVFNWQSSAQGRQGAVESYFTIAGIERPHRGIWGVYAALESITQDSELARTLTMNAQQIGAIEPITTEKARELYDRIRARVGPHANIGPRPGDTTPRKGVMRR